MQIYARTSMVKVQDAPSVAHVMITKVHCARKQKSAYLLLSARAVVTDLVDLLIPLIARTCAQDKAVVWLNAGSASLLSLYACCSLP